MLHASTLLIPVGLVGEKNDGIFKDFKTWSLEENQENRSILNQTKIKGILKYKIKDKGIMWVYSKTRRNPDVFKYFLLKL